MPIVTPSLKLWNLPEKRGKKYNKSLIDYLSCVCVCVCVYIYIYVIHIHAWFTEENINLDLGTVSVLGFNTIEKSLILESAHILMFIWRILL